MCELTMIHHAKLNKIKVKNRDYNMHGRKLSVISIFGSKKVCLPASATVEASLVIPIYIYAVLAVMYIMQILSVKSDMDRAVYNALRSMSKHAYMYENDNAVFSQQEMYLRIVYELGAEYANRHNIVGGNAGIVILQEASEGNGSEIKFSLSYAVKNPFNIFGLGVFSINQKFCAEAWLGQEYAKKWKNDKQSENMVYITSQGTVYHKSRDCRTINIKIETVSSADLEHCRNSSGAKYYPCERCGNSGKQENYLQTDQIYITDYGDRYHFDINCSALKRTVFEIPFSAVGERGVCKICSQSI